MSTSLFNLAGKTALVTGSSRGLGFAIAEGMAAAGARLVLNGVDASRLEAAAATLRAKGHHVEARAFDVCDEAAVVDAFKAFDAAGLDIDILVKHARVQF